MITEQEKNYVSVEQKELLLRFLKEEFDLDFTHYSEASVRRRIAKILSMMRMKDVETYIELLRDDSYDINEFLNLFTVNVTEMFRDPFCFKALAGDIFPVFRSKDKVRIWAAGCSSGEEVLALAILLQEAGLLERCEILGTDISTPILEQAKQARYQLRHVKTYQEAYLQAGGQNKLSDYYRVEGESVYFDQNLLRGVKYEKHNLLKELPAENFDFVMCRNVLIYFDSFLQNQVLNKLYRSLAHKGFLMVGSKENILFFDNRAAFEEVQYDIRIYQKH